MRVEKGDIWDYHKQGYWLAYTTNGVIRTDGTLVMGAGIAAEVATKFPEVPLRLGNTVRCLGNYVHPDFYRRIVSFPVKNHYKDPARIDLIARSARQLRDLVNDSRMLELGNVALVKPGCGVGGLTWEEVEPVLDKFFDDRFIIVDRV